MAALCLPKNKLRRLLVLGLLGTLLIPTLFILFSNKQFSIVDRKATLIEIEKAIKVQRSGHACKHPKLPVNSPEINKFFKPVAPIKCGSAPDWVTVEGSVCVITDEAKQRFGEIYCQFTDVIRKDDFYQTDGHTTNTNTQYQLTTSDTVTVQCKASSGAHWRSVLTGIRHDSKIKAKRRQRDMLDVLMLGFDSLSHNTFIRKLPQTFKYLTETMGAHVLNGYNIVGDGTPQALIPILTGQNELELPETRKRISDSNYVDVYPFVWKEFAEKEYVTAFWDDMPNVGTFQYRLRGFKDAPTDHYARPYYLAAQEVHDSSAPFCRGNQPRHKIMLDYIEQFFHTYRRNSKFFFAFHGELSHDSANMISAVDKDVLDWLKRLNTYGFLNNTLFIFMSDHGSRFAEFRNTLQGKQEERLPFFSFAVPKWFKHKYPVAYNNLKTNVDRLSTPYDIYPTLKHVLNFKNFKRGDLSQRSISLFDEIPEERSCGDAYIEPHWCTCLDWDTVAPDTQLAQNLAEHLVASLNKITSNQRELCQPLQLDKIGWVQRMAPTDELLQFKQAADLDGFVPDLSKKVVADSVLYQIQIETMPNKGIFEASITQYRNDTFHINTHEISRINKYGAQSHCIFDRYPDLRKYCYCGET